MAGVLELVRALRRARHFDDAAGVLLAHAAEAIRVALGGEHAELARGLVHLRSESTGYRALAVEEWDPAASHGAPVAPSATVFALVERRAHAVGLDLGSARGLDLETGEAFDVGPVLGAADAAASRQRMLAREVTHVIALPLVSAAGAVAGMVSLELSWPLRAGAPWPASGWAAPLCALVEAAGPVLVAKPVGREERDEVDALLPVLGEQTRSLVRVLRVFVAQDETLLVTGPTGAGKTRLAEWCHARSPRRHQPFRTANLLAVPETMQLGELFGWRKGAFTGAQADHQGLVESAEGGTLFLDEIDKLSLAAQSALLRLLETRRAAPLGGGREREVDVRFIVGTNADLRARVAEGAFREDLYYRINVLPVHLPPLAERLDEIPGWSRVMLGRRHADAGGRGVVELDPGGLAVLAGYAWPGNLRQLDNVLRRTYALWLAEHADDARLDPAEGGVVAASIVRRALALEGPSAGATAEGPARALSEAARRIVAEAIARRDAGGPPLALAELDVLRAAVLRAAVDRLGNVKDAYLLFGGEALVQSRNHTKDYRRECEALEALEARLEPRS